MFSKTNMETVLQKTRDRRISAEDIMNEVAGILAKTDRERDKISNNLQQPTSGKNVFNLNLLEADRIYHLDDIRKLCITYRLRFLDSNFFKGQIPEEAISRIRQLEKDHDTPLTHFKVMAPSKLLKLENADDPLLFAPMGNNYFYLIHKWGNDLHPFRKLLMWPYKNFENLVITVFLLSALLTAITPMGLFTHTAAMQEYILMFLFMFKSVGGIVLFYGFAKGKNFNNAIWDSKYYNA